MTMIRKRDLRGVRCLFTEDDWKVWEEIQHRNNAGTAGRQLWKLYPSLFRKCQFPTCTATAKRDSEYGKKYYYCAFHNSWSRGRWEPQKTKYGPPVRCDKCGMYYLQIDEK